MACEFQKTRALQTRFRMPSSPPLSDAQNLPKRPEIPPLRDCPVTPIIGRKVANDSAAAAPEAKPEEKKPAPK